MVEIKETPNEEELFAKCGMYCGICTSYLSYKYQIPRRRGIISYCKGCRPREKNCSFIKKKCIYPEGEKFYYCIECPEYPCKPIIKINNSYASRAAYSYDFQKSLRMIQEEGWELVIKKLKKEHRCEKCGEILCIHNNLCYNCDKETLATMKNYRNDK